MLEVNKQPVYLNTSFLSNSSIDIGNPTYLSDSEQLNCLSYSLKFEWYNYVVVAIM